MEESKEVQSSDFKLFTNNIILVEPTNFGLNDETLIDNKFMKTDKINENIHNLASLEFRKFSDNLMRKNINTHVYQQLHEEAKDSIFPNNWFSTHRNKNFPDGLLIIYPMKSPSRRLERNPLIINNLKSQYKYFIDLTYLENELSGEYLESTGSLIFDNHNNTIFCGISERCTPYALKIFIDKFNELSRFPYKLVTFKANDSLGNLIYHTNVVVSVLEKHIVICSEAIQDLDERNNVLKLINTFKDKKLLDVSLYEMENFCCNILCLSSTNEKRKILVLSKTAYENFAKENLSELDSNYDLCINNISHIEKVGGGSCRCMIAEIF
jgi:hypothetical protein